MTSKSFDYLVILERKYLRIGEGYYNKSTWQLEELLLVN